MSRKSDIEKNNETMLGRMKTKAGVAFFIAILIAVILIIRVIAINITSGEEYSKKVLDHQTKTSKTITGKRGEILDRNGTILAYSKKVYNLIIDPNRLLADNAKCKEDTIEALVSNFDIKREDIEEKLNNKPSSKYEKMLVNLEESQIQPFLDLEEENSKKSEDEGRKNIDGVWFEDTFIRAYPFNSFACDAIGFASVVNGGEIGLEKQYDNALTGVDGIYYTYVDENLEREKVVKEPVDGNNIITTIDYGVQNILEKYIKEYNEKKPSANTAVIAMDPNNGEILGMASYPFFDLNNPRDLSVVYKPEELKKMNEDQRADVLYSLWSNFCTSRVYEPGSTFKSITIASALEDAKAKDGDRFSCSGSKYVEGYDVGCWRIDVGGHGDLDLEEALADSCNVALMEIGLKMGAETMIKYQSMFGFGNKTGIDLPGEERGIIYDADSMTDIDVATNSFGQSINVNMIQMVAAYSSLINGGNYYQPHMVKAITDARGNVVKTINPSVVRRTVTKETSDTIRRYLEQGVEQYAVQYSKVEGYSMGGKTATAQKIPRSEKKWLVSVMSFAPVDNPKILLYVLIDEPDGTTGGSGDGMDSQTLTKTIMTELLPYLTVSRTDDNDVVMPKRQEEENPDGGVETPDNVQEYDYDKNEEDEEEIEAGEDEEDKVDEDENDEDEENEEDVTTEPETEKSYKEDDEDENEEDYDEE